MKLYFLYALIVFQFVGCSSSSKKTRILSPDEMQKHGLNGIIHDVELCEHIFNGHNQVLVNSGRCEIINCRQVENKIVCTAQSKK
ncbi:MAG: hypothetical protein ACK4VO_04395 [Pseudobdellovibrio sp.]